MLLAVIPHCHCPELFVPDMNYAQRRPAHDALN